MKRAVKYKAVLSFLLCILLFWICYLFAESDWSLKISYAFHETLYIPVNIGLFLIPIVAVIMIIASFVGAVKKDNAKQSIFTLLIILVIFVAHMFLLRYAFSFVTTMGYAVIENKIIDEEECYIYVNNEECSIRLRCPPDIYDQLTVDRNLAYHIEYKWSTWTPNKGKLIEIKPDEVIDNR